MADAQMGSCSYGLAESMRHAVTALFVPADRPERIDKALASGADVVIVDLEDAVAPDAKPSAREVLANWAAAHADQRVLVRINATDTPYAADDRALVAESQTFAGLLLPKAESADQLAWASAAGKPVWALIETPAGVLAAPGIAAHAACSRLAFGALDFAAATGLDADTDAGRALVNQARAQIVMAAAAAGQIAPLDSPHPAFRDSASVAAAAAWACGMGFGGQLAIHPAQLEPIRQAFTPDNRALAHARRVVEAADEQSGRGAIALDGAMIDAPVIARARAVLARAERLGAAGD